MRRPRTVLAATLATVLAAISALHLVWAFAPWPFGSRARFADVVVGVPEGDLPSRPTVLAVAGLIAVAAVLVAVAGGAVARPGPGRITRWGACGVAAVLGLRAVAGFVGSGLLDARTGTFRRLDLAVYSPLCLVLAVGIAVVVTSRLSGRPQPDLGGQRRRRQGLDA